MNDYLTKPVKPKELAIAIERWHGTNGAVSPGRAFRDDASANPTLVPPESRSAATIPGAEPTVFDAAGLSERTMGDHEFAMEVSRSFLDLAPEQLANLERWIAAGQTHEVAREAHSIKGAAANLGATALSHAAAELEAATATASLEALRRSIPRIRREFLLLRHALHQSGLIGKVTPTHSKDEAAPPRR